MLDRFQQKYVKERSIPLKHKWVSEVLNPQPEATVVIQKVLRWIERVDAASRSGTPKPPFVDEEGRDIFPEGPWWLTDVNLRHQQNKDDKTAADVDVEDGPASENEEEEQGLPGREESDEDPLSGAEEEAPANSINPLPFPGDLVGRPDGEASAPSTRSSRRPTICWT